MLPIVHRLKRRCRADYAAGVSRWREITRDNYWYMLGVVPPLDRRSGAFLCGEPYDHVITDSESGGFDAVHAGFVEIGNRYFGRLIPRKQFPEAAEALRAFIGGPHGG